MFGLGRYGGTVVREFSQAGQIILGVDFDPEIVQSWNREGLKTFYGDADDHELAAQLPLKQISWIINTVPTVDVRLTLLNTLHGN